MANTKDPFFSKTARSAHEAQKLVKKGWEIQGVAASGSMLRVDLYTLRKPNPDYVPPKSKAEEKADKAAAKAEKAEVRAAKAEARAEQSAAANERIAAARSVSTTPAGWYPDPDGAPNTVRYWDGATWTENRHSYTQQQ